MPIHGLKADLELVALVLSAGAVSYFATGQLVSNVLFTFLLASLFFLEGLHLDIDRLRSFHRSDPFSIGFLSVFLFIPVLSLAFGFLFREYLQLFLVLGVSSVGIGSPLVWSNIAGGNGKTAETLASTLLASSLVMVPFLILAVLHLEVSLRLVARNLHIVLVPFLIGVLLHNSKFEPIQDMRFHFSKLSFWLIVLITLVQLQLVLYSNIVISAVSYTSLGAVLGFYVFFSFLLGFVPAKMFGINEKNSRAVGFVTSTRNIGLAFFLGSLISGEIVLLVGIYYFIRQVVGLSIADLLMHNELKFRERIGF